MLQLGIVLQLDFEWFDILWQAGSKFDSKHRHIFPEYLPQPFGSSQRQDFCCRFLDVLGERALNLLSCVFAELFGQIHVGFSRVDILVTVDDAGVRARLGFGGNLGLFY